MTGSRVDTPVESLEATRDCAASFVPGVGPGYLSDSTSHPSVTIVEGGGPNPHEEVRALLHRRLRTVSVLAAAAIAAHLILEWLIPSYAARAAWFDALFFEMALGTAVAVGGFLATPRPFSIRTLRWMEMALFGVLVVAFGWDLAAWMRGDWQVALSRPGTESVLDMLAADSCALPWMLLIAVYGTLIPNTWTRSVAIVSILAAIPVLIVTFTGLTNDRLDPARLLAFASQIALVLTLMAATAIYGSNKLTQLRAEVLAARRLGQYSLGARLGRGGMGDVYLAEHLMLKRPCVVKLIRAERLSDGRSLMLFEREVRAMARLSHPNSVEIYDYGHAEDGTFYYTMEYLDGLTLQTLVERHGGLPPGRVVHLIRQVCGALREAHDLGLIHRDIKPSNIMVCRRGGIYDIVKVLDYGLVRAPQQDEGSGERKVVMGSPLYMPPEQALGMENVDERGDLYSLGCVMYFLLTGDPPFDRPTSKEVTAAHLWEPFRPLSEIRSDVPADLESVIERCLSKSPSQRFLTAEALDSALAHCACAGEWTAEIASTWWQDVQLQSGVRRSPSRTTLRTSAN